MGEGKLALRSSFTFPLPSYNEPWISTDPERGHSQRQREQKTLASTFGSTNPAPGNFKGNFEFSNSP
jgi:hypothetical protein